MKYKILVLDLDGTLTNKKKEITAHTRETLIRAQEAGVKIVLASGRPTYGIVPLAEELRLGDFEGYILSYNGGQIIDWKTKKMMYENELDPKVYPYLYECAKKNGFVILSYKDEYIVSEDAGNPYVQHEAFLNRMPSITVPNFLEVFDFPVPKCLIVGDPEPLSVLEQKMKQDLEGRMNVFRSEPFFLELVPNGIDKARSLAVLLDELGMKPEEMVAVGMVLGMTVDFFMGTAGINTIATLFAAFCRPAVLTLLVGKDEVKEGGVPNVNRIGLKRFLRYAGVIVLLHGTVFFVLESLTWSFFYLTLLRIICSSVITLLLVYFCQKLFAVNRQGGYGEI